MHAHISLVLSYGHLIVHRLCHDNDSEASVITLFISLVISSCCDQTARILHVSAFIYFVHNNIILIIWYAHTCIETLDDPLSPLPSTPEPSLELSSSSQGLVKYKTEPSTAG